MNTCPKCGAHVPKRPNVPSGHDTRDRMQDIAHAVDERIPEGFGFMVLVFPFGADDGRANYVSSGQRADVIRAMKEFIIKAGAGEDWMKHL